MLDLVLARHGESYGNVDYALGPDTDLTETGRRQATALGEWLAREGYRFELCYCSTLHRARQTAEIINSYFDVEIIQEPDLREARPWLPGVLPHRSAPLEGSVAPLHPDYAPFREQVVRALERILGENTAGQVLVVAHAGTLGTMVREICGSHSLLIYTDLAGIHRFSWDGGIWTLHYLNRREHLV
jgi:broad specificity phosphatase PhoE